MGKAGREEETENAILQVTKPAREYFVLPKLLSALVLPFLSLTVLKHCSDIQVKVIFKGSIYYHLVAILSFFSYHRTLSLHTP